LFELHPTKCGRRQIDQSREKPLCSGPREQPVSRGCATFDPVG
jgi:hypothetical protein